MWHYRSLHAGCYYLIKEKENATIHMVYVAMTTDKCVLIEYQQPESVLRWFSKEDEIAEVIEQLSEEHAQTYEELFEREHDTMSFEDWEAEDEASEEDTDDQLWRTLGSSSSVWDAPEDDDDDDSSRLN